MRKFLKAAVAVALLALSSLASFQVTRAAFPVAAVAPIAAATETGFLTSSCTSSVDGTIEVAAAGVTPNPNATAKVTFVVSCPEGSGACDAYSCYSFKLYHLVGWGLVPVDNAKVPDETNYTCGYTSAAIALTLSYTPVNGDTYVAYLFGSSNTNCTPESLQLIACTGPAVVSW